MRAPHHLSCVDETKPNTQKQTERSRLNNTSKPKWSTFSWRVYYSFLWFYFFLLRHSKLLLLPRCWIARRATSSVFRGSTNIVVFICLLFCWALLLCFFSPFFFSFALRHARAGPPISLVSHLMYGCVCVCVRVLSDLITPYFTLQMNNRNEVVDSDAQWRYLLQIIFRRHEKCENKS